MLSMEVTWHNKWSWNLVYCRRRGRCRERNIGDDNDLLCITQLRCVMHCERGVWEYNGPNFPAELYRKLAEGGCDEGCISRGTRRFFRRSKHGYFNSPETKPCETFEAVFAAVTSGKCDFGLIPIENSLAGSIHQNYDLLLQNDLYIVGEYFLRVRHCLIGFPGVTKSEIRQVISHPQALGQCAGYLRDMGVKTEPVYDTAGSVKMLKASGEQTTAAIASRKAAEIYGMQILQEGIEDNPENYTRFLAIAPAPVTPSGEAKTSIVFILKNQPGALFKALSVFALRDIDLTKIESPSVGRETLGVSVLY